jgi:hypothetical protein
MEFCVSNAWSGLFYTIRSTTLLYPNNLKVGAAGSSEIFVPVYQVIRRNVNNGCSHNFNSHNASHRPHAARNNPISVGMANL